MAGFTPGPWVVYTPDDYDGPNKLPGLGVDSANGDAVVWYATDPETGIKNDADAHLIAAAPELYEALGPCIRLIKGLTGAGDAFANAVIDNANAAIAKAEVRS